MRKWLVFFISIFFLMMWGCDNTIPPSDNEINLSGKQGMISGKWEAATLTFPDGIRFSPEDSIGSQLYFFPKSDSVCRDKTSFFVDTVNNDTFCVDTLTIYRTLPSINFYKDGRALVLNLDIPVTRTSRSTVFWKLNEDQTRIILTNSTLPDVDKLDILTLKDSLLEVRINTSTDWRILSMEKK